MRKSHWVPACLALALGWASATVWADWVQDGGSLNVDPGKAAEYPKIALDNGTPYVAWNEGNTSTPHHVYVKRWNGSAWMQIGGSLNVDSGKSARHAALAMSNGTPYVVWDESNGTANQIYVKHWNGGAWAQDGASLNVNTSLDGYKPWIAISNNTPYVVWGEWGKLYVKHWNGASWVQDGGILNVNVNSGAAVPTLAISDHGTPYATWEESYGSSENVYVKHWNGSAWVQDGGSLNVNLNASAWYPSIAFSQDVPYVAWHESNGAPTQIYVKHWTGSNWVQDGGSLNVDTGQMTWDPSLAINYGVLDVTWVENTASGITQIYSKHWNGTAWVQDGGNLNVDLAKSAGDVRSDMYGGIPYVTWPETNGAGIEQVYVKHWAGAPLATPTATVVITSTPVPPQTSQTYFKLENNAINPNRGEQASIQWRQPQTGSVTITIYNILGDKVITLVDQAIYSEGQMHTVVWKGNGQKGGAVGSGVYLVHLKAGDYVQRGKIAVVK